MIPLFHRLFQSSQNLLSLLTGFGAMLLYYFIRKNAKLEDQNKQLKETLHDTDAHAHKVVETQQKQAEIAAEPSPDRDDIHDWLRGLSDKDKS